MFGNWFTFIHYFIPVFSSVYRNPTNEISAIDVSVIAGYYDPNQDETLDEFEDIQFYHDGTACTLTSATRSAPCQPVGEC